MKIEQFGRHLFFVSTTMSNWIIYAADDGVTLIDSGYPRQRGLLSESLRTVGADPAGITAVLVTHGHLDHIGGIPWLVGRFGTPVYTGPHEALHLRREFLEQVTAAELIRNAGRPGMARWTVQMLKVVAGGLRTRIPSALPFPMRGALDLPGQPVPIATPGHTTGHTAYYFPAEQALVSGDALVTAHPTSRVHGPQLLPDLFHTDVSKAAHTLDNLRTLDTRLILPGHGPSWREAISPAIGDLTGWEVIRPVGPAVPVALPPTTEDGSQDTAVR